MEDPGPLVLSDQVGAADVSPDPPSSPTTTKIDLRSLEYVSEIDRNIVCPICRCPFVDPVRLPCDHTFCRDCLDTALFNQSSSAKSCPSCRTRNVHLERLSVPRFILHLLDDLAVKCPKSSSGCVDNLKRSDAQSHVDHYCGFTEVACPSETCSLKVPRNLKGEKCLHVTTICDHCQEEMSELSLVEHSRNGCIVKTTPCAWCQQDIVVAEMESHSSECPLARQKCDAHSIGCRYESNKEDMQAHAASCPLRSLLPTMQALQRQMDDQNTTIHSLRSRNKDLEDTVTNLQNIVAESSSAQDIFPVATSLNQTSQSGQDSDSRATHESPLFDSATHHMLSMHESLREELDRLSAAILEVDGRTSMAIINETLRLREELTHANAAISSLRIQLQWLTSARLQAQHRGPFGPSAVPTLASRAANPASSSEGAPALPTRRLSDSARQDTKL